MYTYRWVVFRVGVFCGEIGAITHRCQKSKVEKEEREEDNMVDPRLGQS
jgi:hypothetical protein